jgi:hypothetical protein
MYELTEEDKQELLETLASINGFLDAQEMLEVVVCDSVVPAICTKCESTYDWEPDCEDALCEECDCTTVQSCMVLAGVI